MMQRVRELREKHPECFAHPKARADEIWLGDQIIDLVIVNVPLYRNQGMPSARYDPEPILKAAHGGNFHYHSVFVNVNELVKVTEATQTQS